MVNCKLLSKSLLELSLLPNIHAIDAYIFWSLSSSLLSNYFFYAQLPLSLQRTFLRFSLLYLDGFVHLAIIWYTYQYLEYLQGGNAVRCMSESTAVQYLSLDFIIFKNIFLLGGNLYKKYIWLEQGFLSYCFYQNLNLCRNLNSQCIEMK